MGTFKAVGYPEDVGLFYRLEDYKGYSWTAHGRYPTNTPGWGAVHPFTSLFDYSIVHNGEISFPMMQTAVLSRCSVINVRSRPIRK